MEEQEWKDIVDELSQQIATISIERAVSRAQVRNCLRKIEMLKAENEELNSRVNSDATIQKVTRE